MSWILKQRYNLLAVLGCLSFFCVSYFATFNSSATFDEGMHIFSGYHDLTTGDYSINIEHPPLVKDIAALPLQLFLKLKLPQQLSPDYFLYNIEQNNPNTILNWAHLAVALFNTLWLFLIYLVLAKAWNKRAATLGIWLVGTCIIVIAHGALVTMDVMSALLQVLALSWAGLYIKQQKFKLSTAAFVIIFTWLACLAKFSSLLVLPVILIAGLVILKHRLQYLDQFILFGIILTIGLTLFYIPHVRQMEPTAVQQQLTEYYQTYTHSKLISQSIITLSSYTTAGRALAIYAQGIVMVKDRLFYTAQTVVFLNQLYHDRSAGWFYFPVLFAAKLPLPTTALIFFVVGLTLWHSKKFHLSYRNLFNQPVSLILGFYVFIYGALSLGSSVQIGIRHIMPVIVISLLLCAKACDRFWPFMRYGWFGVMLVNIILIIITFPNYLSYYNILAGGTANGYHVATDSNYDWGQDLKRLSEYVQEQQIKSIYGDLAGHGMEYYLGKYYQPFDPEQQSWPPAGSYMAVSVSKYQFNVLNDQLPPEKKYTRFDNNIITRIGESIFIYKMP